MRSSNLLLIILLILAVLTWYFALQPQQFAVLIGHLHRPPESSRPPVTCAHLLTTMTRTYDADRYDFVCEAHWTGIVELSTRPTR